MLLLLVEEDPVCHEDWYWLSRTFHSRRFFFMSRSLFEKNQKIILIKLGLAWTAVFPPGGLQRPQVHPLWLQGTILFEELWQRNEKSPASSSSFELCTRSAMRLEKRRGAASFEYNFNAALGKLDGKKHLSCAHLFHKRLLKMRVGTTLQKIVRFCKEAWRRHHICNMACNLTRLWWGYLFSLR